MELEDPTSLDKPIGTFVEDYGDYSYWQGKLEIDNDQIGLSPFPSDVVAEVQHKAYEAAKLVPVELNAYQQRHSDEIEEARSKGILPP
jgi:hypothetical protein